MAACALAGLAFAFNVATLDAPIYFGYLHADYPDPKRPVHLKGVMVSTPEFLIKTILAVALLATAVWLWRFIRTRRDSAV